MPTPGDPLGDRIADGREDAFADLFDRYGALMFQVAWAILRRREDAEDAIQEVFVALARTRRRAAEVANWQAYLLAAVRKPAVGAQDVHDLAAPEPRPIDGDRSLQLESALKTLPADQRELLALKIDGGLTFAEIAALLGISPNTAASRYRYALEKLRALMQE
jgi:RNA polymerase sigma-70 factor (ECF subfamily)